MKIQSLSIVVPNRSCVNSCKFCVSHMNADKTYKNQMDDNLPFFDLYMKDYLKRLEFARDNGCNTVMLTGNTEPQQNRKFLTYFGMFMQLMKNPFHWIEMQTTGVMLDQNYLRFLRNHVGVNLISLSLSALNSEVNGSIIDSKTAAPDIEFLCSEIKRYDFALRLSLNLTDYYDHYFYGATSHAECDERASQIFDKCKDLGADQVTLRVLYTSGTGTPQDLWIESKAASKDTVSSLRNYVQGYGKVIGILPHGAVKYSVNGVCVVIDEDCMDKETPVNTEDYKYLILQPDCKLYSQWDDPSSLIF